MQIILSSLILLFTICRLPNLSEECKYAQKHFNKPSELQLKYKIETLIEHRKLNELRMIMSVLDLSPMYKLRQYTIFEMIMFTGDMEMAKYILSKLDNINIEPDYLNGTILDTMLGCKNNNSRGIIKLIRKRGGKEIYKYSKSFYKKITQNKKNPNETLAKINFTHALKYYLVTLPNDYPNYSIKKFDNDIKRYLDLGADLNKVIIFFYKNNKFNSILKKHVTSKNINLKTYWGNSLLSAVWNNNLELMMYLLKHGANINLRYKFTELTFEEFGFQNIFEYALLHGSIDSIEFLLENNVVTYNQDFLFALKSKKRTEIIKLFLKYNYNFKFIIEPMGLFFEDYFNSYTRSTPLIISIKLKYFDIAKMIYSKTYLNYIEPYLNKTALDYSIEAKNKEIISLLRKHGAKRSCEILNTKCEPLSPEIEKILKNDKK